MKVSVEALFDVEQCIDIGSGETLSWRPHEGRRMFPAPAVYKLAGLERVRKDACELPDWGRLKIDGRLHFTTAGLAAAILHYGKTQWDWLAWGLIDEAMKIREEGGGRTDACLGDLAYGKMFSAFFSTPYQAYERGVCGVG
ncbi:hypothetical protein FGW37_05310 [Streptomyces rectiverticillatus]|uniref:hypothetical protein n=1 Tax=Streptomyces rectiverticillatus TaxID=173860 RepID=UPI0015C40AF6|nr:hypothetical protein [Streptomyces rectiverticillatus]QLE71099.1 hypothetical protein FGW37_05310 [Streptomyces rectiverticillatus]